jgi:hypothetical protein
MARILREVTGPVDLAASRYRTSRSYVYEETGKMAFEIYKRVPIAEDDADQYTVIQAQHQYRPDLMAYEIWGFSDLWWVLLVANNITDIYDFDIGKNIRVPAKIPVLRRAYG